MGKHRWKGELARPIYQGTIPRLEAKEGWVTSWDGKRLRADRWTQAVERGELVRKLDLLRKHYEIKSDKDFASLGKRDLFDLALRIAMDHVPGFRVKQAALKLKHGTWGAVIRDNIGRHTKWTPEERLKLRDAVKETRRKHKFSTDREALDHLIRTSPDWRRPDDRSFEGWRKTLQNQLARNPEK